MTKYVNFLSTIRKIFIYDLLIINIVKLRQHSGRNIKKSNLIFVILLMAFIVVLISFVLDYNQISSLTSEVPSSSTMEIRGHNIQSISHSGWGPDLGCANCHLDPIDNSTICTDLCHYSGGMANSPDLIINYGTVGKNVTLPHHNETRPGFNNCLSISCHEDPSHPDDARYIIWYTPDHNFCGNCHNFDGHNLSDSGSGGGGRHDIHTTDNDRGPDPPLDCGDCHGIYNPPAFADGQNLENTIVCDGCHSPNGGYDGVAMAKDNWYSGVYNSNILQAGKEIWCATCHDEGTSVISGVNAPNIAGDGVTYGYYVTGHGQESLNYLCTDCHDTNYNHIDGIDGTYDAPYIEYQEWGLYQEGYRLKLVNGEYPMSIPYRSAPTDEEVNPDHFRLCFDSGCHDSAPFINDMSGNAFRDNNPPPGVPGNYHYMHLTSQHNTNLTVGCMEYCHSSHQGILTLPWDSDWDGTRDSDVTCTSCHNVHGSKSNNMIRTGEGHDIEPGFNFKYLDSLEGEPWNFKDPQTLEGSTGGAMDIPSVFPKPVAELTDNGICLMCHDQRVAYYRTWP